MKRVHKPCRIEGCPNVEHLTNLCQSHGRRLRLYGDPLGTPEGDRQVIYMRGLVGLPATGPTPEQRARWLKEESVD